MDKGQVGVIGAGTMGSGIAQVCALAGYDVILVDVAEQAVAGGLRGIHKSLARMVKGGKLTEEASGAALQRLRSGTQLDLLAGAALVIEAATERVELKVQLLRQVGNLVAPDALIASNTSSLSITQLAAALPRPGQFIGMHFFNPVPVMALLELTRGLQTSDQTHALAMEFARAIGKTPITVRNRPGFVVNRILVPMINEAIFVLQEGLASAVDIDQGMKLGCNQPIGPLALADLIGLDVLLAVVDSIHDGLGEPKYRPAPLLREMVAAGRLGCKSGSGFYHYDK